MAEAADRIVAAVGWIILVVLLCTTVVPGLAGSRVFAASDLLSTFAPWSDTATSQSVTNSQVSDTIDGAAPTSILIADQARTGHWAQWDPYNSGGVEAASLPNSASLSPLSLPWYVLPHRAASAAVKLLEVAAIALGMHLLLRREWKLLRSVVPMAAIAYSFSGFMVAWTNWPQTRVAALIPLLLWATERLARGALRSGCASFGIVLSFMLLGGFPAVTVQAVYVCIIYFLCRTLTDRIRPLELLKRLAASGAAVMLGGALSAVQVLPFVYFTTHYVNLEDRDFAGAHLDVSSIATVLWPTFLGTADGTSTMWIPNSTEALAYIGIVPVLGVAAALALAPYTRAPRGTVLPLTITAAVAGWAATRGGEVLHVIQMLPTMSSSHIGRARAVVAVLVIVVAAIGLDAIATSPGPVTLLANLRGTRPQRLLRTAVDLGLAMAWLVIFPVAMRSAHRRFHDWSYTGPLLHLTIGLYVCTAVVLVAVSVVRSPRGRVSLAVLVMIPLALPALVAARTWWPLGPVSSYYPVTATHRYLDNHLGEDRYAAVDFAMLGGTASAYQERSLGGHGFTTPQWHHLMTAIDPAFFKTPTWSSLSAGGLATSASSPELDRLGVRYLVLAPDMSVPGTVTPPEVGGDQTELSAGRTVSTGSFSGPARGIVIRVLEQHGLDSGSARLTAKAIADDTGSTLASTSMRITSLSEQQQMALDLDELSTSQSWHVELTMTGAGAAAVLSSSDGSTADATSIGPTDDGLNVAATGSATILERTRAVSRVHWAGSAVVMSDENERIAALTSGSVPTTTVILEHAADAETTSSGSQASLTVTDPSTDEEDITVTTSGPGWVVIEDPMRDAGWSATLDGQPTELRDADQIASAIWVPSAGTHSITVSYSAPLLHEGLIISAASWLGVTGMGAVAVLRKRRELRLGAPTTRSEML